MPPTPTLLTIGPVHDLVEDTVYALPARATLITAGAVLELSLQSTTGFTSVAATTTGVSSYGWAFARCTTAATKVSLRAT